MKKDELIKLKELVNDEVNRRKRVNELLKNELVKEYLELNKIRSSELDSNNINEIINNILSTYTITKTNGIYVCTSAYYIDYHVCYEETESYAKHVPINSSDAAYRIYTDIESGERKQAAKDSKNSFLIQTITTDFEKENIVLNPYNTSKNNNGYREVRMDFFTNAINYGQTKSKKLLLEKYPRL